MSTWPRRTQGGDREPVEGRPVGRRACREPARAKKIEPKLDAAEDVANWKLLAEDTQAQRERSAGGKFTRCSPKTRLSLDKLTKWLYKEVLHADLDDPYLGLGNVLFANYPFTKEDRTK